MTLSHEEALKALRQVRDALSFLLNSIEYDPHRRPIIWNTSEVAGLAYDAARFFPSLIAWAESLTPSPVLDDAAASAVNAYQFATENNLPIASIRPNMEILQESLNTSSVLDDAVVERVTEAIFRSRIHVVGEGEFKRRITWEEFNESGKAHLRNDARAAIAALSKALLAAGMMEGKSSWVPLNDAPLDTLGLLWAKGFERIGTPDMGRVYERQDGRRAASGSCRGFEFTHWMPLPKPPLSEIEESK